MRGTSSFMNVIHYVIEEHASMAWLAVHGATGGEPIA
jgi:hypothetical protein